VKFLYCIGYLVEASVYHGIVSCSKRLRKRHIDIQALGALYYRRVVSCHCELFLDVYRFIKKSGCMVVVEVGRQRNNRKIERIKF
jgi:hypothetical protein